VTVYVALLRSVNVAGHGRMSMSDVQRTFETLGYTDVSSYIQTGNIIFRSPAKSQRNLTLAIEGQLASDFGSSPAVILRTGPDLVRIAAASPFPKKGADPARHHVTFLAEQPDRAHLEAFRPPPSGRDELLIDDEEVYVHTPDGYATTKLTGTYLERHLGVVSTTRNWNTVTKLSELVGA
jgi:uncharacterized protein (DUF1697 family)